MLPFSPYFPVKKAILPHDDGSCWPSGIATTRRRERLIATRPCIRSSTSRALSGPSLERMTPYRLTTQANQALLTDVAECTGPPNLIVLGYRVRRLSALSIEPND